MARTLGERELVNRIKAKFAAPAYATFAQVANTTGWASRFADAISMGLWKSRGMHLHGFECKSHRSDWLRELKSPEKADEIAQYCHFWWVVTSNDSVCRVDELPEGWGLLVAKGNGLHTRHKAVLRQPSPITHSILAAILRRAQEAIPEPIASQEEVQALIDRAVADIQRNHEQSLRYRDDQIGELHQRINSFQEISGVNIGRWDRGNVAVAVKAVLDGWPETAESKLTGLLESAKEIVSSIENVMESCGGVSGEP